MTAQPTPAVSPRSGNWTVLTGRSTARFSVRNFGFNRVPGTIPIRAGSVRMGEQGTAVEAELDLGALDTGNPRRDADLRKPNLLDSQARPVLRFAADRISEQPGGWVVDGMLDVRGTSCPVTLTVERFDSDDATRIRATGVLDRAPLGMRVPRFVIGHYVEITVEAWLASV